MSNAANPAKRAIQINEKIPSAPNETAVDFSSDSTISTPPTDPSTGESETPTTSTVAIIDFVLGGRQTRSSQT